MSEQQKSAADFRLSINSLLFDTTGNLDPQKVQRAFVLMGKQILEVQNSFLWTLFRPAIAPEGGSMTATVLNAMQRGYGNVGFVFGQFQITAVGTGTGDVVLGCPQLATEGSFTGRKLSTNEAFHGFIENSNLHFCNLDGSSLIAVDTFEFFGTFNIGR
jgi:hypothetical protein